MKKQRQFWLSLSLPCVLCLYGLQIVAQQQRPSSAQDSHVILGVLEDTPGEFSGESDVRVVRAVFEKKGGEWRPFPTQTTSYGDLQTLPSLFPKKETWFIAFDGRNLGTITAQTPPQFRLYSEIGIEHIISVGPVPTIGKRSAEYAVSSGTPVFRPLVAVSQPNFSDPNHWRPAQLPSKLVASARQQFRNKFPESSNCESPGQRPKPRKYRDEDIRVTKAYSSNDGWSLIELNLTGYACDEEQGGQSPFTGQWYVIEPTGQPRFLGTNMWLVDAGDYDNSGKSELLFSITEPNTGGYRLYYRDFAQVAEFLFHYH